MAERKLDALTFAEIEGSDRAAFERITFRPRLMVDSRQLDLTTRAFRPEPVHADPGRSGCEPEAIPPGGRAGDGARRLGRQGR